MRYLLLVIPLLFLSSHQTQNCGCEDKPQINVLAVVNGFKITKQDLSIDTKTQVSLIQDTVIAARARELERQINQTLVETEAKRRGLTATKLLESEVIAKIVQPTESEAKVFYNENRSRNSQNFNSVKKDIITRMRAEREAARATEFARALRAGAQITVSELPVTPPTNEAELSRVFATINGVNITSHDIEQGLLPLILRVQQQVYALRKQDVDLKVNDYLLDKEAKRMGVTPQALIDQNVRIRVPMITDEQARAFYEQNKAKLNGEFKDLKVQIMQHLIAQEERKLFLAYAEQLRKGAAVQIYLTEPQSPPDLRQLCCNPVN